jgi:hypothetical protein
MRNSEFANEVVTLIEARINECGLPEDQALKDILLKDCLAMLKLKLDENSIFSAKKRLLRQAQADLDCQQKKLRDQSKTAKLTTPTS